jgi:hypothetical protein
VIDIYEDEYFAEEIEHYMATVGFDCYLQRTCGLRLEKLVNLLEVLGDAPEDASPARIRQACECRQLSSAIARL